MEIAAFAVVCVCFDARFCARSDLESLVYYKETVLSYLLGELCKCLEIVLFVALYVKMVGVGRCYCCDIRLKMQE